MGYQTNIIMHHNVKTSKNIIKDGGSYDVYHTLKDIIQNEDIRRVLESQNIEDKMKDNPICWFGWAKWTQRYTSYKSKNLKICLEEEEVGQK